MMMLNLTRVNHATLVPENVTYLGMLKKSKDYITWGEVDADTIETLLKERGRMVGDKPVDDAAIKESSKYKTVAAFSKAWQMEKFTMKDVEGLKPIFRLHPPRGSKGWGESKNHIQLVGF